MSAVKWWRLTEQINAAWLLCLFLTSWLLSTLASRDVGVNGRSITPEPIMKKVVHLSHEGRCKKKEEKNFKWSWLAADSKTSIRALPAGAQVPLTVLHMTTMKQFMIRLWQRKHHNYSFFIRLFTLCLKTTMKQFMIRLWQRKHHNYSCFIHLFTVCLKTTMKQFLIRLQQKKHHNYSCFIHLFTLCLTPLLAGICEQRWLNLLVQMQR